jgi:hypothetical protein
VKWDSSAGFKADPSQKSFIFTLKNPHNFPARKFALKAEKKDHAIFCDSSLGPTLIDLEVSNNCNANTESSSFLGFWAANDTRMEGRDVLTGSQDFTVKEIEVFEITD